MAEKYKICMMPDGTGGVFDALQNDPLLLQSWETFGIKYLHIMGVDNMLGRPCDPTLLGMLKGTEGKATGVDVATKVVPVGNHAKLSRVVVENRKLENGELVRYPGVLREDEFKGKENGLEFAVYNDFACTVEFVRNALARKSEWETLHKSEKEFNVYVPPSKDVADGGITLAKSFVFERDIYDPLAILHPKRFAMLKVNPDYEYAPVKNPQEPGCLEVKEGTFLSAIV